MRFSNYKLFGLHGQGLFPRGHFAIAGHWRATARTGSALGRWR